MSEVSRDGARVLAASSGALRFRDSWLSLGYQLGDNAVCRMPFRRLQGSRDKKNPSFRCPDIIRFCR